MYLLILIYNKIPLSLSAAVCPSCRCENCSLIYQKSPTNFPLIKFLQGEKCPIYKFAEKKSGNKFTKELYFKKTSTKSGSESGLIIRGVNANSLPWPGIPAETRLQLGDLAEQFFSCNLENLSNNILKRKQSQRTLLALISKNTRMLQPRKAVLRSNLKILTSAFALSHLFICFYRSFVCLQAKSKALE